jgi:glutamyl-tRNA synthetase
MNKNVRVRYAPSPTGYIHIGNLRTALYNYLFARHNDGKFIVRIEDTDRTRYVPGAVENLISTLKWVGLDYDEGPEIGGAYESYFQSERLTIYKEHADFLIKNKKAYYCFCTPERLTQLREEQKKTTKDTRYDKHCLHLSEEEIKKNLEEGKPYVIRLNVEPGMKIAFKDIIRGDVEFSSDVIDDQILIKSDGFPTYHLANIIDDHLMEISHVIRGEEWLPSAPKHILLYKAFGWEPPQFAHLPLLLNPDRSKLSKRQGDVAVEDYRKKGYLKEALINFISLLGWTAGDDKEIYKFDELIKSFSLERVNDSGAVFDIEKLNWINEEHLRSKPDEELIEMLREEMILSKYCSVDYSDEYMQKVIEVMKPRITFVKEIYEKGFYFFEEPTTYEEAAVKKSWKPNSVDILKKYSEKISALENPSKEDYEKALVETSTEMNVGKGAIIHPLRLAVSGVSGGPGIYDIFVIIGKEKVKERIKKALERVKV